MNADGCGRSTEWCGRAYHCGDIEDLKHSDHIILCNECKKKKYPMRGFI